MTTIERWAVMVADLAGTLVVLQPQKRGPRRRHRKGFDLAPKRISPNTRAALAAASRRRSEEAAARRLAGGTACTGKTNQPGTPA